MTVTVRNMRHEDLDRVYEIEKEDHWAPWGRDILRDCLLVGYDCRVLEYSSLFTTQVIGYMICRHQTNVSHILNICVASSHHRRGYGSFLIQNLLDSLSRRVKIQSIRLEVRPSNKAALELYKKFGFKKDSIKKDYYDDEHGVEDAIILVKSLKK